MFSNMRWYDWVGGFFSYGLWIIWKIFKNENVSKTTKIVILSPITILILVGIVSSGSQNNISEVEISGIDTNEELNKQIAKCETSENPQVCIDVANLYEQQNTLSKQQQVNLAKAYNNAGALFYYQKNYTKAMKYYTLAAEQGNPMAQNDIGHIYEEALGVKKDYTKAFHYYMLSANQGNSIGEYNIANMYFFGRGTSKDYYQALKFYKLAAKQGHTKSNYNIGVMYTNAIGVEQDYNKAVKYYKVAAKKGSVDAQFNLATMYYFGNGVDKDLEKAHFWLLKASKQGMTKATQALEQLF